MNPLDELDATHFTRDMLYRWKELHPAHLAHLRRAARVGSKRGARRYTLGAGGACLHGCVRSGFVELFTVLVTLAYLALLSLSLSSSASGGMLGSASVYRLLSLYFAIYYTAEALFRLVALGPLPQGQPALAQGCCTQVALGVAAWAVDVVIVAAGWLEVYPLPPPLSYASKLCALRALRLFPPLGAIQCCTVRPLYLTVAGSVEGLFYALSLLVLSLFSFALVGVQLWRGVMQGACGYTDPTTGGFVGASAPIENQLSFIPCALKNWSGVSGVLTFGDTCPTQWLPLTNATPGSPALALLNMTCTQDVAHNPEDSNMNYDSITSGLINAFLAITTEGWSIQLYTTWHTWGYRPITALLFTTHVMLGHWVLVQLVLAELTAQFRRVVKWEGDEVRKLVWGTWQRFHPEDTFELEEERGGGGSTPPPSGDAGGGGGSLGVGKGGSSRRHVGRNLSPNSPRSPHSPSSGGLRSHRKLQATNSPVKAGLFNLFVGQLDDGVSSKRDSALLLDSIGPFARRRRLSSLVDVEAVKGAIEDVSRDAQRMEMEMEVGVGGVGVAEGSESFPMTTVVYNPLVNGGKEFEDEGEGERESPLPPKAPLPWGGKPAPPIKGETLWARVTSCSVRCGSVCGGGSSSRGVGGVAGASPTPPLSSPSPPPPPPPTPPPTPQWRKNMEWVMDLPLWYTVVIANTGVLCIQYYGMPESFRTQLDTVNYLFSAVFILEFLLKVVAKGWGRYWGELATVLEGICVASAVVEAGVLGVYPTFTGLAILRTIRVIRLLNLFKPWKRGWRLLLALFKAVPKAVGALYLLVIAIVLLAIFGRHLYQDGYRAQDEIWPNFHSFQLSVLAVFNILDTENVDSLLNSHRSTFGDSVALYFVLVIFIGSFVILNLLVAIIIDALGEDKEEGGEGGEGGQAPPRRGRMTVKMAMDASNTVVSAFLVLVCEGLGLEKDRVCIKVTPTESFKVESLEEGSKVARRGVWDTLVAFWYKPPSSSSSSSSSSAQGTSSSPTDSPPPMEGSPPKKEKVAPEGALLDMLTTFRKRLVKDLGPKESTAPRPRSLFLFTDQSPLRQAAHLLSKTPIWAFLVNSVLFWSCINMVFDEPRLVHCNSPSRMADFGGSSGFCGLVGYLELSGWFFTMFFTLEVLVAAIDRGFVLHRGSFLRDASGWPCPWGVIDLLVVLVSWSTHFAAATPFLSALRAARVLRALRLIYRFPALRILATSLVSALPDTLPPLALTFFCIFFFALVGLQNLGGMVSACNSDTLPFNAVGFTRALNQSQCTGNYTMLGDKCALAPSVGEEVACRASPVGAPLPQVWMPLPENFDTFGAALVTSFELLCGENWPSWTGAFMSTDGTDTLTTQDSHSSAIGVGLFFIISQVVLKHLCISMFAGAIVDGYFRKRQTTLGLDHLTVKQRLWVLNVQLSLSLRSQVEARVLPLTPLLNPLRRAVFAVVQSKAFEAVTMGAVLGSLFSMASVSTLMTRAQQEQLATADAAFTWVFVGEVTLRLFALGPWQYFTVPWNLLDFSVTLASLLSLVITTAGPTGTMVRMFFRVLRTLRVLQLAMAIKGIRRLLDTLLAALPSVLNVLAVLFLLFYLFAVVAMNVFSGVRYGWLGFMNDGDVNFNSFANAYMTLIRCSTGENFNGIMQELRVAPPYCRVGYNCGDTGGSVAFFTLFFTMSTCVVAQLLAAVVLQAYDQGDASRGADLGMVLLTSAMGEEYRALWNLQDPDGTHLMTTQDLITLLCRLPAPLGLRGSPMEQSFSKEHRMHPREPLKHPPPLAMRIYARRVIETFPLAPLHSSTSYLLHFHQVLYALLARANAAVINTELVDLVGAQTTYHLPIKFEFILTRAQLRWRWRKVEKRLLRRGVGMGRGKGGVFSLAATTSVGEGEGGARRLIFPSLPGNSEGDSGDGGRGGVAGRYSSRTPPFLARTLPRLSPHSNPFATANLVSQELTQLRESLGGEHPDTLRAMVRMAEAFVGMGEGGSGEKLLREALEVQRRVLGVAHASTLDTLDALGSLLESQGGGATGGGGGGAGAIEEAELRLAEAVTGRARLLGSHHPLTLATQGKLGRLLHKRGRLREAEDVLRSVHILAQAHLSDTDPGRYSPAFDLGKVLSDRMVFAGGGRRGGASVTETEALFREAFQGRMATLGLAHPDTITAFSALGYCLDLGGKREEAEHLLNNYYPG